MRTLRCFALVGMCTVAALLAAPAARAGTILVNDATGTPTSNCTLTQAIYLADLTANGGPPPYGSTPPGATTIDPLGYMSWSQTGTCAIVPDGRSGYTIDLAAIAGSDINLPDSSGFLTAASWYGFTSLPAIATDITIEGRGVRLVLPHAGYTRFFFVGADPQSARTPHYDTPGAGILTLKNLTLTGGAAHGTDTSVGGAGAGLGGAIYNQGTLHLVGVTLYANAAMGGNTGRAEGGLMFYAQGGGMIFSGPDAEGMGRPMPQGSTDAGSASVLGDGNGRPGGGVPNGMGGKGGSVLACCGYPNTVGGSGGNGSGGGGAGSTSVSGGTTWILPGSGSGGGFGGGPGGAGVFVGVGLGTSGDGGGFGLHGTGHGGSGGGGIGGGGGSSDYWGPTGGGGGGFGAGGGAGVQGQPSNSSVALGGDGGFGGGGGAASSPTFISNLAHGGYGGGAASSGGGPGAGMGGAIFNHGGVVTLLNSTLSLNSATLGESDNGGGPAQALGGGIFNLNGTVVISYSTIADNATVFPHLYGDNPIVLGDAVYSVAYNANGATGSTQASVVIDNSILGNVRTGTYDYTALVVDRPLTVSGGYTNVAVSSVTATGSNIVTNAQALNDAAALPSLGRGGQPSLSPLQANGAVGRPWTLMVLDPDVQGTGTCIDAWGNPVTTDQRGQPRPADHCDPGAVQRGRPALATSSGNARWVQPASGAGTAIPVDAGVSLSDSEPTVTTLYSATVSIAANYRSAEDRLAFTNVGMGNIAASAFDTTNGRLTLTSSDASATLAQWQAALRAVTYTNLTTAPTQANGALRSVSFVANDGVVTGNVATRAVQVDPIIVLSSAALPGATVGSSYTAAISATGGEGAYTFSYISGAPPTGVTLLADGSLSGVPTAAGTWNFTAKATDAINSSAARDYAIVVAKRASSLALNVAPNPSVVGEAVTLTATVTGSAPTGNVDFSDGATPLCSAPMNSGVAQCATGAFSFGAHTLSASYAGDANHLASNATPVTLTVRNATTTTLASACTLRLVDHQPLTLTATVGTGTPGGSVDFFVSGNVALCSAAPVVQNVATCTTTALVAGQPLASLPLTAAYNGDTSYANSLSSPLIVSVVGASEALFRSTFEAPVAGCPAP